MGWKDISLFKFQQIELNNAKDISDVDKTLFAVCYVFDLTEFQLDNMPIAKVQPMIQKVEKIFASELKVKPCKRIGKYFIEYRPEQLSFGQYVELSFFYTMPPAQGAHYVLASTAYTYGFKNKFPFFGKKKCSHKIKADYFQSKSVPKIIGSLNVFTETFMAFNKKFSALFGLPEDTDEEVKQDKFNIRYGWTFCASQIAEYERISLEEAYKLPVMQALNDLVYLKEKVAYDDKKIKNAR